MTVSKKARAYGMAFFISVLRRRFSAHDLIGISLDVEIVFPFLTGRGYHRQHRVAGMREVDLKHIVLNLVHVPYLHAAQPLVRKIGCVGIVKGVRVVVAHDLRAVNRRIQQADHCQYRHQYAAEHGACHTDLLVFIDDDGVEDHPSGAKQADEHITRHMEKEFREIPQIGVGGQKNHGQQDQAAPPGAFFHIVSHITHGETQDGPDKPVRVVFEQLPAHIAEGHLQQIDQRLADEEKDEAFQSRVEIALAVHDDEDAKENPHLHRCGDGDERGTVERGDDRHGGGVYAGDDRGDDHLRPRQIKSAEKPSGNAAPAACLGMFHGVLPSFFACCKDYTRFFAPGKGGW